MTKDHLISEGPTVNIALSGGGFKVIEIVDRITASQILAFIDSKKPRPTEDTPSQSPHD